MSIPKFDIPFNSLGPEETFDSEAARVAITRVLYSGSYLFGKEVARFESAVARLIHKDLIGVSTANGTDAITLMLKSCLPEKSIVAVSPIAPPAVLTGILRADMVPIFCDVEKSGLISVDALYELYSRFEFDAVLAIDIYGQLCDMERLSTFCKGYGIKLLEDAAQSFWSKRDGYGVGEHADAIALSFYPTKVLGGIGDSGAVLFRNQVAADKAKILKFYNVVNVEDLEQGADDPGFNSRMDEIQAAFLTSQFQYSYRTTIVRKALATLYSQGINPRLQHRSDVGNGHLYTIIVANRPEAMEELKHRGIQTKIHYPTPLHRQPCYESLFPNGCPRADFISSRVMSLPLYPTMVNDQIDYIIKNVNEVCREA